MPNHFSRETQSHDLVPHKTYRCSWADKGTSLDKLDHKQILKDSTQITQQDDDNTCAHTLPHVQEITKTRRHMTTLRTKSVVRCGFPSDHEEPL